MLGKVWAALLRARFVRPLVRLVHGPTVHISFIWLVVCFVGCSDSPEALLAPTEVDARSQDGGANANDVATLPRDSSRDSAPTGANNLLGSDSCDVPDVDTCEVSGRPFRIDSFADDGRIRTLGIQGQFIVALSRNEQLRLFRVDGASVSLLGSVAADSKAFSLSTSASGTVDFVWLTAREIHRAVFELSQNAVDLEVHGSQVASLDLPGEFRDLLWSSASQAGLAAVCDGSACRVAKIDWRAAQPTVSWPVVATVHSSARLFSSDLQWIADADLRSRTFSVGVLRDNEWDFMRVAEPSTDSPIQYQTNFDLSFDQDERAVPSAAFVFDVVLPGQMGAVRAKLFAESGEAFRASNQVDPDKFISFAGENAARASIRGFVGGYAISYVSATPTGSARTRLVFLRSNLDAVRVLDLSDSFNTRAFPSRTGSWLEVARSGKLVVMWMQEAPTGGLELMGREVSCR